LTEITDQEQSSQESKKSKRDYPRTYGGRKAMKPLPLEDDPDRYAVVLAKMGGYSELIIHDFEYREMSYEVRPQREAENLRNRFNSKERALFIMSLAENAEVQAALKAQFGAKYPRILAAMRDGTAPTKFEVHHIAPLHDSGTNDFDNLVLVEAELHRPLFHRGYWKWIRGYYKRNPGAPPRNVLLPCPKPGVKFMSRKTSTLPLPEKAVA
jgi:hypothetical protein